MAKKRATKKTASKRKSASKRKKKGTSSLAKLAKSKGMTIKQLRRAIPACGKWSVRRRTSTRLKPCR